LARRSLIPIYKTTTDIPPLRRNTQREINT